MIAWYLFSLSGVNRATSQAVCTRPLPDGGGVVWYYGQFPEKQVKLLTQISREGI